MDSKPPREPPDEGVIVNPKVIPIKGQHRRGGGRILACDFIDDAQLPHVDWTVKKLLPSRGVGMLAGYTATGKSFLALDIAVAVALGTDVGGHIVKRPGGVMWLAAEGAEYLQARWRAVRKAKVEPFFELSGSDPSARLAVIAPTEAVPKITDFAGLASVVATVKAKAAMLAADGAPLRLVVIDTWTAATVFQNANEAGEAQKAIDALKAIAEAGDCFVLAIDHFGKNADLGLRGSSAKEAGIDVLLQVNGDRGQTEGLELEVVKLRGGMVGLKMPFSLKLVEQGVDEDGEAITERVVVWGGVAGAKPAAAKLPRSLQLLRRALLDLEPEGRTDVRGDGWLMRAVEEEKLRQSFYDRYTAAPEDDEPKRHRNAKYNAFKHALELGIARRVLDKQEMPGGRNLVWVVANATRREEENR